MIADVEQYFRRCISLLDSYHWLHDIKMTEFFIRRPWIHMPPDWMDYLLTLSHDQLSDLPSTSREGCPPTLGSFFDECGLLASGSRLFPISVRNGSSFRLSPTQTRGLKAKKVHEIERLVPLIQALSKKHSCDVVVDLGCGMGYLAQILAEVGRVKVLGVDCDAVHCEKAWYRALSADSEVTKRIRYVNLKVQSSSDGLQLEEIIREFCGHGERDVPNCVLVSLHGCGDLQAIAYQLFSALPCFKALIGIGCCYHKMAVSQNGFINFPLSRCFKGIWDSNTPRCRFSSYSMRLALQESLERWRLQTEAERKRHINFVAFRSLIELVQERAGVQVDKTHRRFFLDSHVADLESFLEAIKIRASVPSSGDQSYGSHVTLAYEECQTYFPIIEPFTMLQAALKGVVESVILFDRYLYLEESGFSCSLTSIFDSTLSPRNIAILSEKVL